MEEVHMDEKLYELVQVHHIQSLAGETIYLKCPHCKKEIVIHLKALEDDPDTVEVYWGKNLNEINEKRKRVEEEIYQL